MLAFLDDSELTTASSANEAIALLDQALQQVNEQRATMGATINRLIHAGDNLSNTMVNTASARSDMQDADYAQASTDLARSQILQQAATAVLAQANQTGQMVLKLLQG